MTAQSSVGPVLVCSSSECVGFDCHDLEGIERTAEWPHRDKSSTAGNDSAATSCNDSRFAEATESNPSKPTESIVSNVSRSSSELAAASNAGYLSSGKAPLEAVENARSRRVIGSVMPVVEASDTPRTTEELEKRADSEGTLQGSERTQRSSSSSADDPVSDGAKTHKVLSGRPSSSTPPIPIQGQFEMLLRDADTRSSDMERTSEITSQSVSSTQASNYSNVSNNSNLSSNSDVSNNSVCSQTSTSATTTATTGSAESASTKKAPAGPEGSEEEASALSALSNDTSPAASGNESPVQQSPSKKITWGKAKAYPGSETVSELEDERSVEASEMRNMRKRQAVRVPVRPRTPSMSQPPRNFRGTRGKGRNLKRSGSKQAPGRDG